MTDARLATRAPAPRRVFVLAAALGLGLLATIVI